MNQESPRNSVKAIWSIVCPCCLAENDKTFSILQLLMKSDVKDQETDLALICCCDCCSQPIPLVIHIKIDVIQIGDIEETRSQDFINDVISPPCRISSEEDVVPFSNQAAELYSTDHFARALFIWESINEWLVHNCPQSELIPSLINNIGMAHYALGSLEKSLSCLFQALNTITTADSELYATTLNNIGGVYLNRKEYDNAETYHRKAYEFRLAHCTDEQLLKRERHNLATVYARRAIAYAKHPDFTKAITDLERAIDLSESNEEDIESSSYHLVLGNVLIQQAHLAAEHNDLSKAIMLYEKALSTHQKGNAGLRILLNDYEILASRYRDTGRIEDAVNAMQSMEMIMKELASLAHDNSTRNSRSDSLDM